MKDEDIPMEIKFPMEELPVEQTSNTRSKEIGELAGALAKAQGMMGSVAKSKTNPFYKSSYADISDCLAACLPALSKHGLAISQGNRFCNVTGYYITTMLLHE